MNEKSDKDNGNPWIVDLRMSKTRVIAVTGIACLIAVTLIVYAFTVHWSSTVALTVTNPNVQVYSDAGCTTVATSISFGSLQRGQRGGPVRLWIKNLGTNTAYVYWNSTLSQQTNNITETWVTYYTSSAWNGTQLGSGHILDTAYSVSTNVNCSAGTYNWKLTVGAEPVQT